MQDRAEHLAVEPAGAVDLESARRDEGTVPGAGRQRALIEKPALLPHSGGMVFKGLPRRLVDDRADIGADQRRVADREFRHRPNQHRQQAISDIILDIEEAHRRAALPGAVESGNQGISDDLLGQSGGIDDHRVLPAGFGDQRHDRAGARRQDGIDRAGRFGRAGERDAGDSRISNQRGADGFAISRQQVQHVAR